MDCEFFFGSAMVSSFVIQIILIRLFVYIFMSQDHFTKVQKMAINMKYIGTF